MKIVYKDSFVLRLERQIRYIANDNPTAARRFKKELLEKIKTIPSNPLIFRKSIYFHDETVRDLIFKGYTIVFRINNKQIEVECEIDKNDYKTGINISEKKMQKICIVRDSFHGEWNYTIVPQQS